MAELTRKEWEFLWDHCRGRGSDVNVLYLQRVMEKIRPPEPQPRYLVEPLSEQHHFLCGPGSKWEVRDTVTNARVGYFRETKWAHWFCERLNEEGS